MITPPYSSQPLPDALDERVAADLLARGALAAQLLLDDGLRGDAGVVEARLPERVEAPHAVPADEGVLDRPVEGVAHVQRARHVRRRHRDDVGLAADRRGRRGRGARPPRPAASVPRRPAGGRAAPSPSGADPSQGGAADHSLGKGEADVLRQRLCPEYAKGSAVTCRISDALVQADDAAPRARVRRLRHLVRRRLVRLGLASADMSWCQTPLQSRDAFVTAFSLQPGKLLCGAGM